MIAPHYRVLWVMVMSPRNEKEEWIRVTFLFYSSVYLKLPTHSFNFASIIWLSENICNCLCLTEFVMVWTKDKKISSKFKESNTVKHRNYIFCVSSLKITVFCLWFGFAVSLSLSVNFTSTSMLAYHLMQDIKAFQREDWCRFTIVGWRSLHFNYTPHHWLVFRAPSGNDFCGIINNDLNGAISNDQTGGFGLTQFVEEIKRTAG